MVSPGEQGNRLGILRVRVEDGAVTDYDNRFEYFTYKNHPDDPYVRSLIDEYHETLSNRIKTAD